MYSFLILGGDIRQKYLTEIFKDNGYNAQFSKEFKEGFDYIVLPLPCVDNGFIKGTDILYTKLPKNIKIFSGQKNLLKGYEAIDYTENQEFTRINSILSAEGALKEAIENYKGSIYKSKILIIGYGNIGKALSDMLISLNADVTVSARKEADFDLAKEKGIKAINTNEINDLSSFDIVFNTVPFNILDEKTLLTQKKDGVLIELASKPFCAKEEYTKNINYIKALSLPGRFSPICAAKIIYDSIISKLGGV